MRNGEDVELSADAGERPLAVRAEANLVGGLAIGLAGVGEPDFSHCFNQNPAVASVIADGKQSGVRIDVDAVFFRTEMRMERSARGQDDTAIPTVRRQPHDIENRLILPFIERLHTRRARVAKGENTLAIEI